MEEMGMDNKVTHIVRMDPEGTPDGLVQNHVVVVDDHPLVRQSTADYLARDPALEVVGTAETGAQGIELCQRLRPGVVVLDLSLPDMSGLDVARELRRLPQPPAILMQSGTIDRVIVEAALRVGASGYIDKGTSPDELIDAVHAVLRGETGVLRGRALLAQFAEAEAEN
jgi:DNA-binding NarL/FixJ family response regulator